MGKRTHRSWLSIIATCIARTPGEFNGAWSVYPFFDSGTVIVSGIEQGLFVLKPTRRASLNNRT